MITTLRIKKKYIYFFALSLFVSSALVFLLNTSLIIKADPFKEECSEHTMKIDYKYKNAWGRSGSSYIHNILVEIINDELLKTTKNEKNYYFDGEKIEFFGENCEKNSENFFSKKDNIKNQINSYLFNFDKFLIDSKISLSIYDRHIMYLVTTGEEFLGFQQKYEKIKTASTLVKNLIRFLVITFILNLVFYLFNTINFKID